jgi:hypothetical protein
MCLRTDGRLKFVDSEPGLCFKGKSTNDPSNTAMALIVSEKVDHWIINE